MTETYIEPGRYKKEGNLCVGVWRWRLDRVGDPFIVSWRATSKGEGTEGQRHRGPCFCTWGTCRQLPVVGGDVCVFPFFTPCIMNSLKVDSLGAVLSQSVSSRVCEQLTFKKCPADSPD